MSETDETLFQNRSHVRQNVGKPAKTPRSGERGYEGGTGLKNLCAEGIGNFEPARNQDVAVR